MHRICFAFALFTAFALSGFAQSAATCTNFSYFLPPSPYNVAFQANGINHYGTVVGQASSNTVVKAFIKPSSGSPTLFSMPNATYTVLNKRNSGGTSVGFYADGGGSTGLVLTSSLKATSLKYSQSTYSTILNGINKWSTIVGSYSSTYGSFQQGFKYSGGMFASIKYPGAVQTIPQAINDSGVIVGTFTNTNLEHPPHGFLRSANGSYKEIDIPGAQSTQLFDINNSGEIVGGPNYLYIGGKWKVVTVPSAYETFVYGVNDVGTVTGVANYPGANGNYTWKAFTANCK